MNEVYLFTIRQLEILCAIAETGSFTKAAEQLYLTQSTISLQLAAMEESLNTALFNRENRHSVSLTEAGRTAYGHARDILNRCLAMQEAVSGHEVGRLAVGASPVVADCLMPGIMAEYLRKSSDCFFMLKKGSAVEMHDLLRSRTVKIALVGAALDKSRVHYTPLIEDKMVLITPCNAHFKECKRLGTSSDELLYEPLIMREQRSGSRRTLEEYLRGRGIPLKNLNIAAEMEHHDTIVESVAQGIGVAVISGLVADKPVKQGKVLSFPLEGGLSRVISMAVLKDTVLTPKEQDFMAFVQAQFSQTSAPALK